MRIEVRCSEKTANIKPPMRVPIIMKNTPNKVVTQTCGLEGGKAPGSVCRRLSG